MDRNATKQLIAWKNAKNRKPLLLNGARQVGKTWLMKEFGKTNFENTAYVNLDANPRMAEAFAVDFDIPRLLMNLQAETRQTITVGKTLIILDEIQTNPAALTSLKYFCENAPELAIVAAGSLLGISASYGSGFPVGKVDSLNIHPLGFTEFLAALGEQPLVDMLARGDWRMVTTFKTRFIAHLRDYYYVGGMPEAVQTFLDQRDYRNTRAVQKRILGGYQRDFAKHLPKDNTLARLELLWNSVPAQLARENKRFFYGAVREGARAKDFETALQWLVGAGLIHRVDHVSKPDLPLAAYADNLFKIFTLDVGLLAAQCDLDTRTLLDGNRLFTEFKGALTEQYVQQQLRAECGMVPFYWSAPQGTAEIDFLVQSGSDVVPVEVKAEENLRAKSLAVFRKRFAPRLAVKTSMADYNRQDGLVNLPLYALSRIAAEI